jgi:hypothetical protein
MARQGEDKAKRGFDPQEDRIQIDSTHVTQRYTGLFEDPTSCNRFKA